MWIALACGLTACAPRLLATPQQFIELEEPGHSDYRYRATTADGVVLALRVLDLEAEHGGDLAFWVEATTAQLRSRGGYALLSQQDVKTASGLPGKQLRFGRDDRGKPYRYWLTLFVTDTALYVVEAGGRADRFESREPVITAAIASLRP